MSVGIACTEACTAEPECTFCGKRKALRGRSYPLAMANSRCDFECSGYSAEPWPGHLWPSEWRDHASGDHRYCMSCDGKPEPKKCEWCSEPFYRCECEP